MQPVVWWPPAAGRTNRSVRGPLSPGPNVSSFGRRSTSRAKHLFGTAVCGTRLPYTPRTPRAGGVQRKKIFATTKDAPTTQTKIKSRRPTPEPSHEAI